MGTNDEPNRVVARASQPKFLGHQTNSSPRLRDGRLRVVQRPRGLGEAGIDTR